MEKSDVSVIILSIFTAANLILEKNKDFLYVLMIVWLILFLIALCMEQ